MQAAKKLVLVDEFDKEYKRLQRPADAVAKTSHSLQLSDTLCDQSIADDQKVREYIAELHRYLNVRKEVPEEVKTEPNFGPLPPPPPPPPRRRKHQPSLSPPPPQKTPTTRRQRRKRQPWTPY